jgi:hypothetical protein
MGFWLLTSIVRPGAYIGRVVAYGALELDGIEVGLGLGLGEIAVEYRIDRRRYIRKRIQKS